MFQKGETLDSLYIGENVKNIRRNAFGGYVVKKVNVSKKNLKYASFNGCCSNCVYGAVYNSKKEDKKTWLGNNNAAVIKESEYGRHYDK